MSSLEVGADTSVTTIIRPILKTFKSDISNGTDCDKVINCSAGNWEYSVKVLSNLRNIIVDFSIYFN